nr:putative wax ester synthase/acyl-CoA:diacylglycerol acyltransferase [uncultured bacterium]
MVTVDSPTAHNAIGIFGIYDPSTRPQGGTVTYDEVLDYIGARLHTAESYRERLIHVPFGLDRPYWIRDADFDLEYHIRHLSLPRPGSWRQLCDQLGRIHSRPLDLTRPPWEIYIIDGIDAVDDMPEGCFGILVRVHHAAVDGVAGVEMVTTMHTFDPAGAAPPVPADYSWEPDSVPSADELLRRAALNGITRPTGMFKMVRNVAEQFIERQRENLGPAPAQLPTMLTATRFNQRVSPHRVVGMHGRSIETLKQIRRAMPEAKINDIGVAVIGGALRAYLESKDELPDESMIGMMPISVRPTMAQTASQEIGEVRSADKGGNQFALARIPLATDTADPWERLGRIAAMTSHIKQSSGAAPARALLEMSEEAFGGMLGSVQRTGIRALTSRGRTAVVHTLVSNVPGPPVPLYFSGAKYVGGLGMGPVMDGMGMNTGIGSIDGRLIWAFTADRNALPDPEFYEGCLSDAVDELLEASKHHTTND